MSNNILLSIVIPVYNVENYLEKCIQSILEILGTDVEAILVNDGSTDDSEKICKKYSELIESVQYVKQANQGLSEARNTGILNAKGKYILFLDSDDYVYKPNLTRLVETIKNNRNENFFLGRAYQFKNGAHNLELCQVDYDSIRKSEPTEVFSALDNISEFWFAAWLIIINREFLIHNELFFKKGIYHEDELWVPSVFVKSRTMSFLNFGFYCYRLNRAGSIISTHNIKREIDKVVIIEEFDKLCMIEKAKIQLIKKRQASLLFGIILKLHYFIDDKRYDELMEMVSRNSSKLKNGKYYFIYIIYKLIGPFRLSKLLSKESAE